MHRHSTVSCKGKEATFTLTSNWKSQNLKGAESNQGAMAFVRGHGNFPPSLQADTKKKMNYHTLQNLNST